MKHSSRSFVFMPLAASLLWAGPALAADPQMIQNNGYARQAPVDWQNARAFQNPLSAPDASRARAEAAGPYVPGAIGGSVGSVSSSTRAFGSFGIPYTSTRVTVGASAFTSSSIGAAAYLSTTFPYRAVGKLFFNVGPGATNPAHCSAALIRRSVIVTAAHCVQNFGSSTPFNSWIFRPGHWGWPGATATQIAPYGAYTWKAVVRSSTWGAGTDTGSGAARNNDVAVFALNPVGGLFAGQRTGYLTYGWNNYSFVSSSKTGNLSVAATSTLGYPGLMDSGRIMQRADGPSYLTTVGGALQIWQGNNFTGGSSGGPWVVNFVSANPILTGGAVIGSAPAMAVIGVTSWGSSDPNAPKDNYSSRFGQNVQFPNADYGGRGAGNIGALLNALCNAIVVGSSPPQTYAAQGYCS